MIFIIWVVWIANQILVFIILMNFLIAIISQSYEQVMSQKIINKYSQRVYLNRESCLLRINELTKYDCMIFSVKK